MKTQLAESDHRQTALENVDRYCVFKSGDGWFGVPALAVHAVVPRLKISRIPCSDPILRGLGHIQNEFVPVISFQSLTEVQYETTPDREQQILLIDGPQGRWGLLIDQAVTLASLEPSFATVSDHENGWSRVTAGSASFQQRVIQVLDPVAMFHYAANLLGMYWQSDVASEKNNTFCN